MTASDSASDSKHTGQIKRPNGRYSRWASVAPPAGFGVELPFDGQLYGRGKPPHLERLVLAKSCRI